MSTQELYEGHFIVTKQEEKGLGVFVGKLDDLTLTKLDFRVVAVRAEFPELDLPETLVLHGGYTDKEQHSAVQEMKTWIDGTLDKEPTVASRKKDHEALARSYWKGLIVNLDKQTEQLSGHISSDMHHKIASWKLNADRAQGYKILVNWYITEFEQESRENDSTFCRRISEKNIFMLDLWVQAGFSLFQLEAENHQFLLDGLRELRAHRRAKEIRFDHFMDKKLVADEKFYEAQLAVAQAV